MTRALRMTDPGSLGFRVLRCPATAVTMGERIGPPVVKQTTVILVYRAERGFGQVRPRIWQRERFQPIAEHLP